MKRSPEQAMLAATIDRLANQGLEHLQDLCRDAQTEEHYFVPIVIIASVRDSKPGQPGQLITSTCMYARNQPQDGVARLLKVVAAHLAGKPVEGSEGEIDYGRSDA